MMVSESISEIGSKVIFKVKCHDQRHVSLPLPYGKCFSSQQLSDLPKQSVRLELVFGLNLNDVLWINFKRESGFKIIFKI